MVQRLLQRLFYFLLKNFSTNSFIAISMKLFLYFTEITLSMKRNVLSRESETKPPPTKKPKVIKSEDKENCINVLDDADSLWRVEEELQYDFSIGLDTSRNICRLLDDGKTIPFIAR